MVAARTGKTEAVVAALRQAIAKDASLAERAASDLEFVKLASNEAFRTLLK